MGKWALCLCALGQWLLSATAGEMNQDVSYQLAPGLAAPFGDNGVLQQKVKVPVWGSSLPGATVIVTFSGQTKSTHADEKGGWRIELDPMDAPRLKSVNDSPVGETMKIVCEFDGQRAVKELTNLLVGDVWICAGQSNMAGRVGNKRMLHWPTDTLDLASYPALRRLAQDGDPWTVCSPTTAPDFGKVAFFFARRLQQDALVPIGLIRKAVGGSSIESWLNKAPYEVGGNYTRLMQPIVGYGIKGAIWYQGESNAKDGRGYQPKLEALITGWREAWGMGDFPFYYVQLPGIGQSLMEDPAMGDGRAEIRQACVEALALPNTGLVVTIDVGATGEHPPNKVDTGDRLARAVLRNVYGFKAVGVSPLYKTHRVEGRVIRVSFSDAEGGLMLAQKQGPLDLQPPTPTPDATLGWLSMQDEDGTWHWASGAIDGAELIVSSDAVAKPQAVRYAYTIHPTGPLLYSKEGLPVGPFSTIGYGPYIGE
ncbi:MAG TPA: hypothetical protein DCS43_00265 [Verrucomicrobia bacterium]|nr:hypothetical protein [Verrucomicrobiota bacterium]